MDKTTQELVTRIAKAALGLPSERRICFVEGACNRDRRLVSQVNNLVPK